MILKWRTRLAIRMEQAMLVNPRDHFGKSGFVSSGRAENP